MMGRHGEGWMALVGIAAVAAIIVSAWPADSQEAAPVRAKPIDQGAINEARDEALARQRWLDCTMRELRLSERITEAVSEDPPPLRIFARFKRTSRACDVLQAETHDEGRTP
jgi:hypothetical protein